MQTPPTDVTSEQVLACARSMWDPRLVGLEHLPVGFGAHHWRAEGPDGPVLFLSLDTPTTRHNPQSLERAYAATAALAAGGLEFIHVNELAVSGAFTVPEADPALVAVMSPLAPSVAGRHIQSVARWPERPTKWLPGQPVRRTSRRTSDKVVAQSGSGATAIPRMVGPPLARR